MSRFLLPLLLLLPVVYSSCYEDRVGCLDPDAANYDLVADESCPDCCAYPVFSVGVATVWEGEAFVPAQLYTDGAGNAFRLIDFRYYLGDLRLLADGTELPEPQRAVPLTLGDGTETTLNGNYTLGTSARSTREVGAFRLGVTPIAGFAGSYGLPDRFRTVVPASAPSGDALRTQPRRLNYLDGNGYVQSRLEYTLAGSPDTLSVSTYGSVPFTFRFAEPVTPARGADIRLELEADLSQLLGELDLTADSATLSAQLSGPPDFIVPTAIVY